MEELQALLEEMIGEGLQKVILSNPLKAEKGSKVKAAPVLLKDGLRFQETLYRGTQVFHCNCTAEELIRRLLAYIKDDFRQAELVSGVHTATVLVSKKGKITIKKKRRGAAGEREGLQKENQSLQEAPSSSQARR